MNNRYSKLFFSMVLLLLLVFHLNGCDELTNNNNNNDPELGDLVSVEVLPANPTILINQTRQFTATGHYSNGGTQDITSSVSWGSENVSVASINSGGLAIGLSEGSVTITAVHGGAVSGNTQLTVQNITVTLWETVSAKWNALKKMDKKLRVIV
ncbi:MAG: Ig-like domain-containing protein [Ignavibacteria bacterium]|nr:Ig-like domain-containing protein [Ignavibacteria bacterium]